MPFPTFRCPRRPETPKFALYYNCFLNVQITMNFIRILCFDGNPLNLLDFVKSSVSQRILCFFANRLPLCQHAKIAIIHIVFYRVWGQLLRKILKKHPEMHFTVIVAEIHRIYIVQCNLSKIT